RYAPMLFDARRDGRREAWLFGTLHVGTATMLPWPAAIDRALADSGPIAIEIDSARRWQALVDGFRPYVELPEDLTLDALLPPSLVDEVRRHFGWSDDEWRTLRRRQPWWVANFRFGTADDREQQVRRDWGIEQALLRRARAEQRPIAELETVAEHVEGLAGGSLDEQCQQFAIWFDDARHRGRLLRDMLAAWRTGDAATLEALKDRLWGDDRQLTSLRRRFFTDRDQRITRRLVREIERGDDRRPVFAAIGAFHLVGPDSVPALLARQGFDVRRVGDASD
ncbi:MAG: TraB/GumN family protein, partial [Burkholderiaceae bacterium]